MSLVALEVLFIPNKGIAWLVPAYFIVE